MGAITSFLLFFVIMYGLGYGASLFIKKKFDAYEGFFINVMIGFGLFPLLGVLMDILRIPLHWVIFLILALIGPAYSLFKNKKIRISAGLFLFTKKRLFLIIVLLLAVTTLFVYNKGAFSYPWLEDDDPWHHAKGIKYVEVEKIAHSEEKQFMYIDPYPPGYDLLIGVFSQTNDSLSWSMKFFNNLIVSLSLIFFFLFASRFFNSNAKAAFAVFVLFAIPSYLSHFIWAHAMVFPLLFASLFCLEMAKEDKRWAILAGLAITSICLTQPTQPIKFVFIYGIYLLVSWLYKVPNVKYSTVSVIGGYVLSVIWWHGSRIKEIFAAGMAGEKVVSTASMNIISKLWFTLKNAFPNSLGSATRQYTFDDFFIAKSQGLFTSTVGWGIVVSILVVIGIVFLLMKLKNIKTLDAKNPLIMILWFLFAFLGVNSLTFNLPFGLFAFRFWILLSVPVALICSEALFSLKKYSKEFFFIVLVIVVIGVYFTSAQQKFTLNTSTWPYGIGWKANPANLADSEIGLYTSLKSQVEPNTKLYSYTANFMSLGFDFYSCEWCDDVKNFNENGFGMSVDALYDFLKRNNYEYFAFTTKDFYAIDFNYTTNQFQTNKSFTKLNEIGSSGLLQPVMQNNGGVIFKVG